MLYQGDCRNAGANQKFIKLEGQFGKKNTFGKRSFIHG